MGPRREVGEDVLMWEVERDGDRGWGGWGGGGWE